LLKIIILHHWNANIYAAIWTFTTYHVLNEVNLLAKAKLA